ncbi:MAG: carbamoyl-phosphate synthase large subunit, partial [Actinomycetota bacterium]
IGASTETIRRAEDRRVFKETMAAAGLSLPRSAFGYSVAEAVAAAEEIGLPVIIRPSYVLGGGGSGVVSDLDSVRRVAAEGLRLSSISEVLVEESIEGWREFELELMRDRNDNVVVVCSIENLDPMGVHTGDSVTVAPAMTLTDVEYQAMRDDAISVMRAVGVETGGSNVQFAVEPATGRRVVIEMNPRVSRSSALASKATGFPIAKIAAKLAVGYSLDEIPNNITGVTPASFEPSIDYVAVKLPRFSMEKFPASGGLGTKMKSVGEVMAMGRTFLEALGKGRRALETEPGAVGSLSLEQVRARLTEHHPDRLELIERALELGLERDEVAATARLSPWFVAQLERRVEGLRVLRQIPSLARANEAELRRAKRLGLSDVEIASCLSSSEAEVRARRKALGVLPSYKNVDTCAAEFEALTPYLYSAYEDEDEGLPRAVPKVVILGSGPNRIGQGIEFDYCCVHAALALGEAGYETIMVNCNPETVSTDPETSDRLYFEPLTFEDVMNVIERERPDGVILTLGGQTPLKLAAALDAAGVSILGTPVEAIDRAEDRERFAALLADLRLPHPPGGIARSLDEAVATATTIGYPVLVRPSYVLGGRAMEIVYSEGGLKRYLSAHGGGAVWAEHPVLVDRFLEGAIEVDCDAVFDGAEMFVGGVLEHIEEAGIHSGDSACTLPPITLSERQIRLVSEHTEALARGLGVRGLLNVQYALKDETVYVLEANPRASRTVPFVSKATGVPLAKVAARMMAGASLAQLRDEGLLPAGPSSSSISHIAVKEAVMPFDRFPGTDTVLGPEMRSTGEVMGIDDSFGRAFGKAEIAAGVRLPAKGTVFISVADRDKRAVVWPAKRLSELGFDILATKGTAEVLGRWGVDAAVVPKASAGNQGGGDGADNVVQRLRRGEIDLVLNTPWGPRARSDGYFSRTAAVEAGVPSITTVAGMAAAVQAIESLAGQPARVRSLQDYLS